MPRGRLVVSGNPQSRSASLYINLTFGSFCVFPYSSFIIALKTTKLGMYTLLELSVSVSLCCNKKLKNLKAFSLGQFRYVAIHQFRCVGCSTAARCL
jgi:hypothetical protein